MHINWRTEVQVPNYANDQLNEAFQRHLSRATDDDLLAAYLHWTEGRIALDCLVTADDLMARIQFEADSLARLSVPVSSRFAEAYRAATDDLRSAIDRALSTTEETERKARETWQKLCNRTPHDLAGRYQQADGIHPDRTAVELLGPLGDQNAEVEQNIQDALLRHRNEMHRLAALEEQMAAFLASDDSFDLEDVHRMTPYEFEHMVATLARRDGLHVVRARGNSRDLGADVIAVTAGDLRVVFQCKHRHKGVGKVVSRDMQTLNGTARPEHQADIVIAVTNGTFTKPAIDFARSHDIQLLDGTELRRWATWGDPLLKVLGLNDSPVTTSATTQDLGPLYVQAG
ncbi:restriction endonuclease [Streptomyces microflavus]|uniref:restriction endonuclease n=1 Tax=Streptomyces microflavus TaxID=1919 RepID=UPI0037D4B193